MEQRLLWIPPGEDKGGFVKTIPPVPYDGPHPDRVWTLYNEINESTPPTLPIVPVHRQNSFLEDYVHDWNIDHKKRFRYASRVCDGGVWVLLEFKD